MWNNRRRQSQAPSPELIIRWKATSRSLRGINCACLKAVCLLLAACLFSSACLTPKRIPNLARIFAGAGQRKGKPPIIIIPGVLGSQLVNKENGEVVWPSAFRSRYDGLSLPVSSDLAANRDNLFARKIIDTAHFLRLTPEVYVYHELLEAVRLYGGYSEGDWNHPAEDGDRDTFYVFAYDWRRDNVETAQTLVSDIRSLKEKLHRPDLKFNVIAHSMGGLVARYAAMYGNDDLPAKGSPSRPTWAGAVDINKVLMFGTPNEGSADAFASLLDGYSLTSGLRRRIHLFNKLSREDVLTSPSVFQLLPHSTSVRFLDRDLKPLNIDLFDPSVWKLYGWSPISDRDYRKRFVTGNLRGDSAPFRGGSLDDLDSYFKTVLARAKQFHEALDAPVDSSPPVTFFAFGGDCEDTLSAPIVVHDEKANRWLTLLTPRAIRNSEGRVISRKEVIRAMSEPGDGRVTRRSLLAEDLGIGRSRTGLFNAGLPISYAVFACDEHGKLQNNKTLQDNALTSIISEAVH